MRVGAAAARAGVGVDTIRYYERLGLLPAATRRASGYREFDEAAVERVRLVKELQELGLTLDEVAGLFAAAARTDTSCATETQRLQSALSRLDERISALTTARGQLEHALVRCTQGECDLIERSRMTRTRGG